MGLQKKIKISCAAEDQEALSPILSELSKKGIRAEEASSAPGKKDVVLCVLSENFYKDSGKTDELLTLIGTGAENVLPLQLDGTPIPDTLKNALYARNIIPAEGRESSHTAERIIAALPEKKSRLPMILILFGVVLIALTVFLITRNRQPEEEPVTKPETTEAFVPDIPDIPGLTAEDLEKIRVVIIVGEDFRWYTDADLAKNQWGFVSEEDFCTQTIDENGQSRWYSKEDGHEYTFTSYDDLSFLKYMTNLESLRVQLFDAEMPDLSMFPHLTDFCLQDSPIDDLSFLSGSVVRDVFITRTSITDYSALNSLENLRNLQIEQRADADFSTLSPCDLTYFRLLGVPEMETVDLSGLSGCEIQKMVLQDLPLKDLTFLSGKKTIASVRLEGVSEVTSLSGMENLPLSEAVINNCDDLRDISAIGTCTGLKQLEFWFCDRIPAYNAIAGCTGLEEIHLQCDDNPGALRDASFLKDLPKLWDIGLYGCELRDMDFLEGIADNAETINFGFASGETEDYSGLSYIKNYGYLHINPRRDDGSQFGDLSVVLPYLSDATVHNLCLYDCRETDLSLLPEVTGTLEIAKGSFRDLSTLTAQPIDCVRLDGCQYLSSLSGILNLPNAQKAGALQVQIIGCPRLLDFSALEGLSLSRLELIGAYTVPTLEHLDANEVYIESVEDIRDVSFLSFLEGGINHNSIELCGLEELSDLSALGNIRINRLAVPPQVADQAEDLVKAGTVKSYSVIYPTGSWQPLDEPVELLFLEELGTLPESMLRRVERLTLAGGTVVDPNVSRVVEDWENPDKNGFPTLLLEDRETGEKTPVTGEFTDLSFLSKLTGLRDLTVYGEPFTTLDGIQSLSSLEFVTVSGCPDLTDASALFALPLLADVELRFVPVTSIQGIQNLSELRRLEISDTRVSDLSPLSDCDLSAAYESGGLTLGLNNLPLTEDAFTVLSGVEYFQNLDFIEADAGVWLPALSESRIERFGAGGDIRNNEELSAFAADHPELKSLWLGYAGEITDLTCLTELPDLETVTISPDMEKAIASLQGMEYGFELLFND